MEDIQFPENHFDIIWAEGSIFIIGFEKGLKEWKKYIKPNGYLAVHEMAWLKDNPPKEIWKYWQRVYPAITTIPNMLETIKRQGYKIIGHFSLPEDAWWDLYYTPLEKRLKKLEIKYKDNQKGLDLINAGYEEIDLFRKYYQWYGSVFYVMQKV
jgi:SAM-dependent methyltransferase